MRIPIRLRSTAAASAAAALLATSVVVAAEQGPRKSLAPGDDRQRDTSASHETTTMALGGAIAPYARLVALVDAGGAPVRTKNVAAVFRIDLGVYCIRPVASANINVNAIVPSVSVEYFYSNPALINGFNEMTVQWASRSSGCPTGTIGVYTFADRNLDGHYSFSNEVAFSIVVP
jgi:hypothetical protein